MKKENIDRAVEIGEELEKISKAVGIVKDSSLFTIKVFMENGYVVIKNNKKLSKKLISTFEEYKEELIDEIETL